VQSFRFDCIVYLWFFCGSGNHPPRNRAVFPLLKIFHAEHYVKVVRLVLDVQKIHVAQNNFGENLGTLRPGIVGICGRINRDGLLLPLLGRRAYLKRQALES
jgi:hypothetical protein